jgi:hypothetical protein
VSDAFGVWPIRSEKDALGRNVLREIGNVIFDEWGNPAIAMELIDRILGLHAVMLHMTDL